MSLTLDDYLSWAKYSPYQQLPVVWNETTYSTTDLTRLFLGVQTVLGQPPPITIVRVRYFKPSAANDRKGALYLPGRRGFDVKWFSTDYEGTESRTLKVRRPPYYTNMSPSEALLTMSGVVPLGVRRQIAVRYALMLCKPTRNLMHVVTRGCDQTLGFTEKDLSTLTIESRRVEAERVHDLQEVEARRRRALYQQVRIRDEIERTQADLSQLILDRDKTDQRVEALTTKLERVREHKGVEL